MAKQNKQTADIFTDNLTESSFKTLQSRTIVKRLPWHLQEHIPQMEHNHQTSMTIPDDTLTLLQLKRRMEQGLPGGYKTPVYNHNTYLPNWEKMDHVDRQRYLINAKQTVIAKQKALDDYNTSYKAQQEAKKQEELQKEDKDQTLPPKALKEPTI